MTQVITAIGATVAALGLIIMIVVIVRASPRLPKIPAKTKESVADREIALRQRIIFERIKRRLHGFGTRIARRTSATARLWEAYLARGYRRLRLLAQEHVAPKSVPISQTCEAYLMSAAEAIGREALEEAEDYFLACLKLDPKHREAYLGLAALYLQRKEDALAEETLRFLRKLYPDDEDIHVRLAEVLRDRGKHLAALEEISSAIKRSPRNPRYLDFAIELAIMDGNARLAERYLDQLREANPENQKLTEFEERIAALAK